MTNQELVENFNAKYPVGATVKWRSVNHPKAVHSEYNVRSAAQIQNDQPIVFLEGKAGYVSIEPGFVDYAS